MQFTIRVTPQGKVQLDGPLSDREACLRLLSDGLRVLLAMPQQPAGPPPIEIPDAALVPSLTR